VVEAEGHDARAVAESVGADAADVRGQFMPSKLLRPSKAPSAMAVT
jgi:hypothetical protein